MSYKALVCDLDGTLLNTLEDLADSTNFALEQHGFPSQPTDAYRYFVGSGARKLIVRALPLEHRNDETIDACLETYKKHYATNASNKTEVYEGIANLLNEIEKRNILLAVLTNKPQPFALDCMAEYFSQWTWNKIQGQEVGVAIKPSIEMSSRITNALNIDPKDVLYMGDSDVDMLTAGNAGYTSVGVTWGFRTEQELTQAGAQFIVHAPEDIINLL